MLHIALFQPEIPPNTGNIIRLCANIGSHLHLIHPLGFDLNAKQVRRAGLDYHDLSCIHEYKSWDEFSHHNINKRLFAVSTKGSTYYTKIEYMDEDIFIFGSETCGLPSNILQSKLIHTVIKIPMMANNRSLNLSNSAAIISYEAWRQLDFFNS